MTRRQPPTLAPNEPVSGNLRTPGHLLERVRALGDIGLDPCGARGSLVNAFVEWRGVYDTDDGLVRSWRGHGLVYCFPPSGQIASWAEKIAREARAGAEVIALLPCRVNTAWLHDFVFPTVSAICYWRGQLRVLDERRKSVPGRAVFYWGPRAERFREAFASAGTVVLGGQVHKPSAWTLVVPMASPVGTWVKQQGPRSQRVTAFMKQFREELVRAAAEIGCSRALGPRRVEIIRYGAGRVAPDSLQSGGQLVVDLLVECGLIHHADRSRVAWRQCIDKAARRTEIHVNESHPSLCSTM